ncbi:MAG: MBOAT family protein, partial [Epsilonproteobacteria bacterium]|nr:MBOAT family protein [Campylobacterota bacterium]
FIGYFLLAQYRYIIASKIWLILGSLFFYGYWNYIYIPLILGSIFVNYLIGSQLSRHTDRNLLILGILFNVLLLGYFKYTDFFLENFNLFTDSTIPLPHIILPLGISFFTFTQIAFLVDAYKGKVNEYNIFNYMLFVSYFPHLLAGPILHHKEMMPQFDDESNRFKNSRNIAIGLFIFAIGLFKKTFIADNFALWATNGFDISHKLYTLEAWATSWSYTIQLYFDFSGYTDMAIGISLMFNIILPINFNSPYKALNIQDFWRRWHITLSRFLRDYIYIPLGGNKVSLYHNYLNLFGVFFIGGIWHGASWMFIIWGSLHGFAIVIHRIYKDLGFRMNSFLAWFLTINFINITWIFFRAKDMDSAIKVLSGMFGLNGWGDIKITNFLHNIGNSIEITLYFIVAIIILMSKNSNQLADNFRPTKKIALAIGLILALGILSLSKVSEFLYFNF